MEVSDDGGVHVDVPATADHRNYTEYDVGILAGNEAKVETAVKQQDYWMLSLDLPPIPLFRNSNNDSVVNKVLFLAANSN